VTNNRTSGYDPETGICWQFGNKGDKGSIYCKCPTHSQSYGERTLAYFGRCRSGSRWFWSAATLFERQQEASGWADTEEEAMNAARAAVCGFWNGLPVIAVLRHYCASSQLKKLNEAKRRTRPASDETGSRSVEYLYSWRRRDSRDSIRRFQIIKKTARRIFYLRGGEDIDEHGVPIDYGNIRSTSDADRKTGFVDRQKLEADGEVYNRGSHWAYDDHHLYASLEQIVAKIAKLREDPEPPDLHQLKAEMAAAHPDRGGSNAKFIEARARYVAARRTRHMA
jgi:hypothetical protein